MVVVGEWARLGAYVHALSGVQCALRTTCGVYDVHGSTATCINISYVGLVNDYQEHFSSFCDTLRVAIMVFGDIVHSSDKVVNVGR